MNINEMINNYVNEGYEIGDAQSKTCQDIILYKIGKSKYSHNITIKGGVVMHTISNDLRRATRDLDLDFIKYSLNDESIIAFIEEINKHEDGVKILIDGKIEKLNHQTYNGKRANIILKDQFNNSLSTKLDIGVHKYFEMTQEEYIFDFSILKDSVSLFINSNEQILVEKLKSLLKFGIRSTRYKDVFDFYYLIENGKINKDKIINYIHLLILKDESINQNTIEDINKRLNNIFKNKRFLLKLDNARSNWLHIPINEVISKVLDYFKSLETVTI